MLVWINLIKIRLTYKHFNEWNLFNSTDRAKNETENYKIIAVLNNFSQIKKNNLFITTHKLQNKKFISL